MQFWIDLANYASLVVAVVSAIGTAFLWAAKKEFASTKDVAAVQKRADDAHHRIDLLKKDVDAAPGHTQFEAVRKDIVELKEEQASTGASVESVRDTVRRIDEFLRANR